MPTRRRDLERPLRVGLPFHLGEVDVVPRALREQRGQVDARLRQLPLAVEEIGELGEIRRAEHPHARHDARFRQVFAWQHERLEPRGAGRQGDRQGAAHRPDRALESQLAQHRHAPQPLGGDLLGGRKNPHGDREVERRAVFPNVGGGEIDRDALQGEGVARVREGGVHPLAAFFHRSLRQPDRGERGQPIGDVGFHVDEIGVDPEHRGGADAGEHDLTSCPPLRDAERGDAATPAVRSSDGTMPDGPTGRVIQSTRTRLSFCEAPARPLAAPTSGL